MELFDEGGQRRRRGRRASRKGQPDGRKIPRSPRGGVSRKFPAARDQSKLALRVRSAGSGQPRGQATAERRSRETLNIPRAAVGRRQDRGRRGRKVMEPDRLKCGRPSTSGDTAKAQSANPAQTPAQTPLLKQAQTWRKHQKNSAKSMAQICANIAQTLRGLRAQ